MSAAPTAMQRSSGAEQSSFDAYANEIYALLGFLAEQTTSVLGDDTDSAFAIAGGYRLSPYLAVEGSYFDLGEINYRNDSFGTHFPGEDFAHQEPWFQSLDVSTSGIALSALGILPLSYRWELYLRGGVMFTSTEVDIFVTDFFDQASDTFSETGTNLLAGAGVSLSFAEVYSLRAEYQRVFGVDDNPARGDIDMVSIGFAVTF